MKVVAKGVREYAEEMDVELETLSKEYGEQFKNVMSKESYDGYINERIIVRAYNEGGCNTTQIDLIELLSFVKLNMPEVWEKI